MKLNVFKDGDVEYAQVYVNIDELTNDDVDMQIKQAKSDYKRIAVFVTGNSDIKECFQNIVDTISKG